MRRTSTRGRSTKSRAPGFSRDPAQRRRAPGGGGGRLAGAARGGGGPRFSREPGPGGAGRGGRQSARAGVAGPAKGGEIFHEEGGLERENPAPPLFVDLPRVDVRRIDIGLVAL